MKIIIIGFGWVGQANALALTLDGHQVSVYDPSPPTEHYAEYRELYTGIKHLSKPLELDGQDVVYVVCVGDRVDDEGNQDISSIKKALESIRDTAGKIVLRSTILPSYLDNLKFDIYLPEFLHEKAAVKESVNPQFMVIGKKNPATETPAFIDIWAKRSMKMTECSPEDASHIKYMSNLWNALQIAFTNEFGNSVEEPINTKAVERADKVINFLFENAPYKRYGRSYGGHCLPKDSRAYVKWCEETGRHNSLLKGMVISNDAHRQREEKYAHLPEWFSNWPEPAGSGWVALHILGKSIRRNFFHPIEAIKRRKTVEYRKLI